MFWLNKSGLRVAAELAAPVVFIGRWIAGSLLWGGAVDAETRLRGMELSGEWHGRW